MKDWEDYMTARIIETETDFLDEIMTQGFDSLPVDAVFYDQGLRELHLIMEYRLFLRLGNQVIAAITLDLVQYLEAPPRAHNNPNKVMLNMRIGTAAMAKAAAQLWPQAHILWSPCSCCCGIEDYRKNYPGTIPDRLIN